MKSHRVKDLILWKKALGLSVRTYQVTARFPDAERYGLQNQARRSAVSIASNIAEGFGRKSEKELLNFLSISRGSAMELYTQLHIAHELAFISSEELNELEAAIDEIQRMSHAFMAKITS